MSLLKIEKITPKKSTIAIVFVFGNFFLSQGFGQDRVFVKENNIKIPATDKNGNSCYLDHDSVRYYHFKPIPENLTAKSYRATCEDDGYLGGGEILEYYVNGRLHAVSFLGKRQNKIPSPIRSFAYCDDEYHNCTAFEDGEIWRHWMKGWSDWGMVKIQDSHDAIEQREKEAEIEAKKEEVKNNKFRKRIKVGDDVSNGIIIEIKGNLVKVQTETSQCSQRDYNGSCVNWITTPVEKWVKRSEIYPN